MTYSILQRQWEENRAGVMDKLVLAAVKEERTWSLSHRSMDDCVSLPTPSLHLYQVV